MQYVKRQPKPVTAVQITVSMEYCFESSGLYDFAGPGDWLLIHADKRMEFLTDEDFQAQYEQNLPGAIHFVPQVMDCTGIPVPLAKDQYVHRD